MIRDKKIFKQTKIINMTRKICYFILATLIFLLGSCAKYSKKSYLKSFERFVEKVEMSSDLSDKQLEKIEDEFKLYSETYYEKFERDLTPSEKGFVTKLETKYFKAMMKYEEQEIYEELEVFKEQVNGFFEGMFDDDNEKENK